MPTLRIQKILELSDKYFKEVVIKVFQTSIIKMVEKMKKNESAKKNQMKILVLKI